MSTDASPAGASPPDAGRQRVCLSMIVRDEAHVIARCLQSVRPLITDWCVVDTGSVDRTIEIVQAELADLPGRVEQRPWRDFGHNRTEALDLARATGAEYALVMDADDVIEADHPGQPLPPLTEPAYLLHIRDEGLAYDRKQLFRLDLPWRYVGVAHEFPDCTLDDGTPVLEAGTLEGLTYVRLYEGARHADRRATQLRDIEALRRGAAEEPGNARYAFYLAQTLNDVGEHWDALGWYIRRAAMGGWDEEVFYARLQAGRILAWGVGTLEAGLAMLRDAAAERPWRAEPLVAMAYYLNQAGRYDEALALAQQAAAMPVPADVLFVETGLYGSGARLQAVTALRGLGRRTEALAMAKAIADDESARVDVRDEARGQLRELVGLLPGLPGDSAGAPG